jgi:hypothetical protein
MVREGSPPTRDGEASPSAAFAAGSYAGGGGGTGTPEELMW